MTNDLAELAERVEQATGEQQREMLEQAFYAIHGSPLDADYLTPEQTREWAAREGKFFAMLRAEAFESAAITLVPEGFAWGVGVIGPPSAFRHHAWVVSGSYDVGADHRTGATAALALCSAALRARQSGDGQVQP